MLLAALVLACAGGCTNGSSASPSSSDVSSPAQGVIVAIDAVSLSDVRGFTLRTPGGSTVRFTLGLLEDATEFPPGHLAEHQATSSPVLVYFRVENGERVVYRLEDAEPSASAVSPT